MKCSNAHQLRDALVDAGGVVVDTDHEWSVSFDDTARRPHRLVARYTHLGPEGLDVEVVLHTEGRSTAVTSVDRADDYLTASGSNPNESVTICVTTGAWPMADVRFHPRTALVTN